MVICAAVIMIATIYPMTAINNKNLSFTPLDKCDVAAVTTVLIQIDAISYLSELKVLSAFTFDQQKCLSLAYMHYRFKLILELLNYYYPTPIH